jgi:excisionase family DNA binding protein
MKETELMQSGKEPTKLTQEPLVEFPEIMIRTEAAKFLRMSERHLRWLVSEGRLPEIKGGRRKRLYRKSALLNALDKGLY